jgi:hypothetical protein
MILERDAVIGVLSTLLVAIKRSPKGYPPEGAGHCQPDHLSRQLAYSNARRMR